MAFLTGILASLAEKLIMMLVNFIATSIKNHAEKVKRDEAEGKVNADNIKKYNEALSRADRIKAATDLLNGNTDN